MQIQIEIINVGAPETVPTTKGRSYQTIEVAYKKDGKVEGKKIMSFTNPTVYKTVQTLKAGDVAYVTLEKNDKGYWQWEDVATGDAPASTATATPRAATSGGGAAKATGNWETKEERAERQIMIVRQSSLSNAVALIAANGDKKSANADVAIALAKEFEAYVLSKEAPAAGKVPELDDFPDDVPL